VGLGEVGEEGGLAAGVDGAFLAGDDLEGGAGVLHYGALGEVGVEPVGADDEGVHCPDGLALSGDRSLGHLDERLDVRSSSVNPRHRPSVH